MEIKLEIYIHILNLKTTVTLNLAKHEKVQEIKNVIEREYHIPRREQRLRFKDKILTEEFSLNFYKLKSGVTIYLERPQELSLNIQIMPKGDQEEILTVLLFDDSSIEELRTTIGSKYLIPASQLVFAGGKEIKKD